MRSTVPGDADTNVRNRCRPTWIATYDAANSIDRPPNASGIATAMNRLASISASSSSRTTVESGSSSFVTQLV